ncbi:MAG: putative sugar nucleotidyl transferase [Candidatus Marinimicrobia bacterium]|nr:putative sugar nucleotidyl transferase [Candidatus Neomarinimicrobiota bacterium]
MNIYVYEDDKTLDLSPLSSNRATFDIRIGSETFLDRIKTLFPNHSISLFVREELEAVTKEKHSELKVNPKDIDEGMWLLGNVIWGKNDFMILPDKETLFYNNNNLIGAFLSKDSSEDWIKNKKSTPNIEKKSELKSNYCPYLWDILSQIPKTLLYESEEFKKGIQPSTFKGVEFLNSDNIFIGDNVKIQPSVLMNAENGPIIIEADTTIYGQTYLEGPLYIGKRSLVKPLTQIKNSAFGPMCKLGGEIDTVIIQGYSNKVHEGHLGDSFVGEWVNLGSGTQNSNLKNNYSFVEVELSNKKIETNKIHIGTFIGDYTKTAIGTKLNSGSVIGLGSMIATYGFPSKLIDPFTWYINGEKRKVILDKFFNTTYHCMNRRNKRLLESEIDLLKKLYNKI